MVWIPNDPLPFTVVPDAMKGANLHWLGINAYHTLFLVLTLTLTRYQTNENKPLPT